MNRLLAGMLAVLYPQRTVCHACGVPLTVSDGLLCPTCQVALQGCALPPHQVETLVDENIYIAAAPYLYADTAASLVKALKFGSDHTAALPLVQGMASTIALLPPLRDFGICVPVPVHYRRLRRRGYNQAEVLARALCTMLGASPPTELLLRVHHKRSQIGQGRQARHQNIEGAFAMCVSGERAVKGHTVLLIDDVLTTGATAAECAKVLLNAGAAKVLLLTACRA